MDVSFVKQHASLFQHNVDLADYLLTHQQYIDACRIYQQLALKDRCMASFVMAGKPENGFVLLQQMRWHSSVKDVIELCVRFGATHDQLQAYIQTVLNIIADSNCDTETEVFRVLQVSYALNDNR